MDAYIRVTSGPNTYYYTGSSPASAYAAFRQQTGRTGSFTPISQAAFNSGLAKFGYTPQGTPAKAAPKPVAKQAAPTPPPDPVKLFADSINKQIDAYKKRIGEFNTKNPWSFDEELARQTSLVQQEVDPKYQQKLSDFLQGIETQRSRSVEDESNLLSELKADTQSFTGRAKLELDRAVNASREGFSDAGLFFSGRRLREEGTIEEESDFRLSEFLRGQQSRERDVKLTGARSLEDLARERTLGERGLLEEKATTIGGLAAGRTGEAEQRRRLEQLQFIGPELLGVEKFLNVENQLLGR